MLDWFKDSVGPGCKGKCTEDKMRDTYGFSAGCSPCFGESANCVHANCAFGCSDFDVLNIVDCNKCVKKNCLPDFIKCSGLSLPLDEEIIKQFIRSISSNPSKKSKN